MIWQSQSLFCLKGQLNILLSARLGSALIWKCKYRYRTAAVNEVPWKVSQLPAASTSLTNMLNHGVKVRGVYEHTPGRRFCHLCSHYWFVSFHLDQHVCQTSLLIFISQCYWRTRQFSAPNPVMDMKWKGLWLAAVTYVVNIWGCTMGGGWQRISKVPFHPSGGGFSCHRLNRRDDCRYFCASLGYRGFNLPLISFCQIKEKYCVVLE